MKTKKATTKPKGKGQQVAEACVHLRTMASNELDCIKDKETMRVMATALRSLANHQGNPLAEKRGGKWEGR